MARYLAQRLAEMGIGHLFAVPGDYAGAFLSTIDAEGEAIGIRRVGTCNELEAGYAADAYARLRGRGRGVRHLRGGHLQPAQRPRGLVRGAAPGGAGGREPRLRVAQHGAAEGVLFRHSTGTLSADEDSVRNVTVARVVVLDPLRAPAQIDSALRAALTWRRPVYIEVYQNVWWLECEAPRGTLEPGPLPTLRDRWTRRWTPRWSTCGEAERPVIWAGVEVQRFGLQDLLEELVAETGFPFATDLLGKGVVRRTRPASWACTTAPRANPKSGGWWRRRTGSWGWATWSRTTSWTW